MKKFLNTFEKSQIKPFIPANENPCISKKDRYVFFLLGDLVGFKNCFKGEEGTVLYHRRNGVGAVEYMIKMSNWSNSKQVFLASSMYLKPLTRKILFEKSPNYVRLKSGDRIVFTIWSNNVLTFSSMK